MLMNIGENTPRAPSEQFKIWENVSGEMSKAAALKIEWKDIKSRINSSIKELQTEIKSLEAIKAKTPEEKALVNRAKKFNQSQTAELKKFQKGMLNEGPRIEQQIKATKIFAKQTINQVENKLKSQGIIFKKSQSEMEADAIKANSKVKALNQKVVTVSDNIDKIGKSHAELFRKIRNVQHILNAEQQLVQKIDSKLNAATKALKEFQKEAKTSHFDRSLIEEKLKVQIENLENLKSGIASYTHLDDAALLKQFGNASNTQKLIAKDSKDLDVFGSNVDRLLKVMDDVKVLDAQAAKRASLSTMKVGLFRFSRSVPKEEVHEPPVVVTYLGVMQNARKLEQHFEKLISKTKDPELKKILHEKQEQVRDIGRQHLEKKLVPNSQTEITDATEAMDQITYLQEYLKVAEEISTKKHHLSSKDLDNFINNTVSARLESGKAQTLMKDLSARAKELQSEIDKVKNDSAKQKEHTQLKCKQSINLMMINDLRSRLDELRVIGNDQLIHMEKISPQMIKEDHIVLDNCSLAIRNMEQNLIKINVNSFTYNSETSKFMNIASEWVNTEFEFCLTLETYVRQADEDPGFLQHFPEGDRKLIKDFVESARSVIVTSRVISQKIAEETSKALMNSENPVEDIIAIYKNIFSSAPYKFHLERLTEFATLCGEITGDANRLIAWDKKIGFKGSPWSQEKIAEKFIAKGLLGEGKVLTTSPLNDFAVRGVQRPMRHKNLAESMEEIGIKALPGKKEVIQEVFGRGRAKSEAVSHNIQDSQRAKEQSLVQPLIQKHSKELNTKIEDYVKDFKPDPSINPNTQLNTVVKKYAIKEAEKLLKSTFSRSITDREKQLFTEYVEKQFREAIKKKHFPNLE